MTKRRWCDLSCEHAGFPDADALSGACRTLSTLFCRKHKKLVQKNAPCINSEKIQPKGRKRSTR